MHLIHKIAFIFWGLASIYYNILNIPNTKPAILPNAGNLPLYSEFDSGNNSPETIYSIAPAAKAKHIAITFCDIPPTIAPKNAPIPVVTPERTT